MRIIILLCVILLMQINPVIANEITVKGVSYVPCSNGNISCGNVTISFVVNGGGQVVSGTWYGDGLPDGVKLSYPFEIVALNSTEIVVYPPLNQGALRKYSSYYIVAEDFWNGAKCEKEPKYCFPISTSREGYGLDAAFIVDRISSGSYARFGSPVISKSVELIIKIKGDEYRQVIGSGQDSRSSVIFTAKSGDEIGRAYWTGYTSTGINPPNQDNFIATHLPGENWKISYLTEYEKYVKSLTEADTLLSNLDNDLVPGFDQEGFAWNPEFKDLNMCKDSFCTPIFNILNLHNINYDLLTSGNIQIGYGSPTSSQTTISDDGNIIVTSKLPIGYSEITLVMSASDIGVVSDSGSPQIDNVSVTNISSGDGVSIAHIGISNTGSSTGTFGVRMNGSPEVKITLNPGASDLVDLPIFGIKEGLNNEKIEVYDITTGVAVYRDIQVNVTVPKNGIPNESTPYNGVVMKFDESGMTEDEDIRCPDGIWQYDKSINDHTCLEKKDIIEPVPIKQQIVVPVPTQPVKTEKEESFNTILLIFSVLLVGMILGLLIHGGRSKKAGGAIGLFLVIIVICAIVLGVVLYWESIKGIINNIQFLINLKEVLK